MAEIDLGKVTFGKEELKQVIDQIMLEYSPQNIDLLGSFSERVNISTTVNKNHTISAVLPYKYRLCFLIVFFVIANTSANTLNITAKSDVFALIPLHDNSSYAKVFVGYNESISLIAEGSTYSVAVTVSGSNGQVSQNGFLFGIR